MPKVLIVANWDWVIYNFRLALARRLRAEGYDVRFVCPPGRYTRVFEQEGFPWIAWSLSRRGLNPVAEAAAVAQLARIYADEQPQIVHHSTIKPNVYGALAVRLNTLRAAWRGGPGAPPPRVINSFMGIGFAFSDHLLARLLRPTVVVPLLRLGTQPENVFTTFSNHRDRDLFADLGIAPPARSGVLVSEFVDVTTFHPVPDPAPADPLVVLMGARLLWDKGVGEFVEAARQVRARHGDRVAFHLAGAPDEGAPNHVPTETLRAWHEEGVIRWLGHCSDMPDLLRSAHVAVLPTHYNEGTPRFLVEGAASGLPLVATQIEACERVVRDGHNGFTVPKRAPDALADAVTRLANDPALRRRMSTHSRALAVEHYAMEDNLRDWVALYHRCSRHAAPLRSSPPGAVPAPAEAPVAEPAS